MSSVEPRRTSRIPGKRELTALVLLYDKGPRLNLGEAIEILREELCVTKRTASNIVRRLRRIGAARVEVERERISIEVVSPDELLRRVAEAYLDGRKRRCQLRRP